MMDPQITPVDPDGVWDGQDYWHARRALSRYQADDACTWPRQRGMVGNALVTPSDYRRNT
ncbi:hypothetical protein [Nocardia sp. CNY236]|uniref:hypothetical protein n=1 Tax=Nocardia sp. CNY236 TaxID=1169152 RepID=UPI00041E9361|nr:hypothetical protein [Nocardia sp. CNY236]